MAKRDDALDTFDTLIGCFQDRLGDPNVADQAKFNLIRDAIDETYPADNTKAATRDNRCRWFTEVFERCDDVRIRRSRFFCKTHIQWKYWTPRILALVVAIPGSFMLARQYLDMVTGQEVSAQTIKDLQTRGTAQSAFQMTVLFSNEEIRKACAGMLQQLNAYATVSSAAAGKLECLSTLQNDGTPLGHNADKELLHLCNGSIDACEGMRKLIGKASTALDHSWGRPMQFGVKVLPLLDEWEADAKSRLKSIPKDITSSEALATYSALKLHHSAVRDACIANEQVVSEAARTIVADVVNPGRANK